MAQLRCDSCGNPLDPKARFCGKCGTAAGSEPEIAGGAWQRRPGEIMARVPGSRFSLFGRKDLCVSEGTRALLIADGRLIDEIGPGRYPWNRLHNRLKELFADTPADAALVAYDAANLPLSMTVRDVFTKDPVRLNVTCQAVVRIDDARLFAANVLKSAKLYTTGELRGRLYAELHAALQESLSQRDARELSTDLNFKRETEADIARHLAETFRRDGLDLTQLRTLRYHHERIDRQRDMKEEIVLAAEDAEIALEGRQKKFEALSRDEQQEIVEESAAAERAVERNRVRSRLREALGADRMDELRSKDALEAFELEIGKAGMLREEEREALRRTLDQNRQDADMARAHLIKKLEQEQESELESVRVREDLARAKLVRGAELDVRRTQDEYHDERDDAGREKRRKDALLEAEIGDTKIKQWQEQSRRGLETLREMKRIEAEEASADTERELLAERERKAIEAERLRALSEASTEALIATADEEQARILAELKRTEVLAAASEEKILAMAAERSPEVAKAFQERFKSLGAEKIEALYERMLSDRNGGLAAMRATQSEAVGAMRDVAMASAGRATVAGPRGSQPGTGKILVCNRCHVDVPVGQKHCQNCGAEMF